MYSALRKLSILNLCSFCLNKPRCFLSTAQVYSQYHWTIFFESCNGSTLTSLHTQASPVAYPLGSAVWPLHQFMSYPRANFPTNRLCSRNFLWILRGAPQRVPFHRSEIEGKCKTKVDLISLSSWCVVPRVSFINMPFSPQLATLILTLTFNTCPPPLPRPTVHPHHPAPLRELSHDFMRE